MEQEKVVNSELGTVTEFKTVFNRLTKKHQVNAIKVLIDGANGDAPKEVWLSTNKEHNVNNDMPPQSTKTKALLTKLPNTHQLILTTCTWLNVGAFTPQERLQDVFE